MEVVGRGHNKKDITCHMMSYSAIKSEGKDVLRRQALLGVWLRIGLLGGGGQ